MRNIRVRKLKKQFIQICKNGNFESTKGKFRFFKKLYKNGLLQNLLDSQES